MITELRKQNRKRSSEVVEDKAKIVAAVAKKAPVTKPVATGKNAPKVVAAPVKPTKTAPVTKAVAAAPVKPT